jgi:hypothetical protein
MSFDAKAWAERQQRDTTTGAVPRAFDAANNQAPIPPPAQTTNAKAKSVAARPQQQTEASAANGPATVWPNPQPIPDDLPAVLSFEYTQLPGIFIPFVSDVAERMQCPPDFPAVAIMIVLATVIGKRICIRPKRHDDWLVCPNLWGAVVGRPGIMKTPAIRQMIKFPQRLEIEATKLYANELETYAIKLLIVEEQKRQRKEAVAKAIKEKKDPSKAAQEIVIERPEEPKPRRYIVNDSTVEKLGVLLNQNPNGLMVFRDELSGLLELLDREGQEGARAFYLEAWDGLGRFTYDRIMRGTLNIESVTLSVLGGIQPGKLFAYLQSAMHGGAGDDGLMQRFQLAVYPDVKKEWRNVDRWPDTDAKQKVWEILEHLNTLDPESVGAERDGDESVHFLRFAPDAQALFDDWRIDLEPRLRSGEEHPAIESHLAKFRKPVPAIALLIHLADAGTGPVGTDATRKALAWARYLESHARRIYSIAINPGSTAARALSKRLENGDLKDGFTLREVYRKHWGGLSDRDSLEPAVDTLVALGWLNEVNLNTGGKPKTTYWINPKINAKTATKRSAKSANCAPDPPFGTNGTYPPGHLATPAGDTYGPSLPEEVVEWRTE